MGVDDLEEECEEVDNIAVSVMKRGCSPPKGGDELQLLSEINYGWLRSSPPSLLDK